MNFNHPPCLEKILEMKSSEMAKMHFNRPPWLEKILEIKSSKMAKNAL